MLMQSDSLVGFGHLSPWIWRHCVSSKLNEHHSVAAQNI